MSKSSVRPVYSSPSIQLVEPDSELLLLLESPTVSDMEDDDDYVEDDDE